VADSVPLTDGSVFVLLSRERRVLHLAVWTHGQSAGPLCNTHADWPHYGHLSDFPALPICHRCTRELRRSLLFARDRIKAMTEEIQQLYTERDPQPSPGRVIQRGSHLHTVK
jgi:hypothetical protein